MSEYQDIIENPLFFKWVFNSCPQTNLYWNDYLRKHPHEAPVLLEFKKRLREIDLGIETLTEAEKIILAYKISEKLRREEEKRKLKVRFAGFTKYAAVAILFFLSGMLAYYLIIENTETIPTTEAIEISDFAGLPQLILPEGKSIALNNGESVLDYRNKGEIVLNEDSIIFSQNTKTTLNQLLIPHGSSSKILLSDGSVVWLNAGSRLIYPSVFSGNTRKVALFGEAYFLVSENNNQPFIVQTTEIDIQVLGTEFNVSAYPEDNIIQTVLKKGSVAIRKTGTRQSENDIILKPNQLASFDKNKQHAKITYVNTDFYTLWTDGLLCFENTDLNRVLKKIERYYNIAVLFENPLQGTIKISGKLDLKQEKEEVFGYLSLVSSTSFEQIDETHYKIK